MVWGNYKLLFDDKKVKSQTCHCLKESKCGRLLRLFSLHTGENCGNSNFYALFCGNFWYYYYSYKV